LEDYAKPNEKNTDNMKKKMKKKKKFESVISNKETIHQKIQLWANVYESEYALRLALTSADDDDNSKNIFIARTDPKARYTHIVAESDYLEDFKVGWEYTLRHFVEQYREALQQHPKEEYQKKSKSIIYDTIYPTLPPPPQPLSGSSKKKSIVEEEEERSKRNQKRTKRAKTKYPIKLVSYLKCHYCKLDFQDVRERKEHEVEWHV
jgi:hypothetical protein